MRILICAQPQGRSSDCQYLVFIESGGVGNRFLGVVSALVYSVLTDRAILMSRSSNMSQLLCEPFEKSSWLLPLHFPQSVRTCRPLLHTCMDGSNLGLAPD